jgi:hypothetical protein
MTHLPPALDIYRAANVFVQEHGAEKSALMAEKCIDALVAPSDVDGSLRGKARSLPCGNSRGQAGGADERIS